MVFNLIFNINVIIFNIIILTPKFRNINIKMTKKTKKSTPLEVPKKTSLVDKLKFMQKNKKNDN